MPRWRPSRTRQRKIALDRISKLLSSAEEEFPTHPERSSRYVQLARSIAMRCNVRLPQRWRRMICRRCNALLIPGRTSRVRLRRLRVNVTCMTCGKVYRYPYKKRTT